MPQFLKHRLQNANLNVLFVKRNSLNIQSYRTKYVKSKFKTTCIIFASGKILIVGAKIEKDIEKTIKHLQPLFV
ncbi:MAG TPA: hypothetical protein VFZ46_01300 [Nitrososphaeraceae archaeon]